MSARGYALHSVCPQRSFFLFLLPIQTNVGLFGGDDDIGYASPKHSEMFRLSSDSLIIGRPPPGLSPSNNVRATFHLRLASRRGYVGDD